MSTSALTCKPRLACPPTILKAYKNGEFTDLTIICGSLAFKVHAVVVCTACDFFLKSLKFAAGKEAESKCINLPEDDPEMIRRLIAYLYLGDYDPNSGMSLAQFGAIAQHESTSATNPTHHYRRGAFGVSVTDPCACLAPNAKNTEQPVAKETDSQQDYKVYEKTANAVEVANPLTIHASMYALGDKYQVEGLSSLAKEKFECCLHHHAQTEDFIAAVQIAYSTTPDSNRGLRNSVMEAFRTHFQTDIASIPGAEAKLDSIDELSFLLIKSWPQKIEAPNRAVKPASGATQFGSVSSSNTRANVPSLFASMNSTVQPATTASLFGTPRPSSNNAVPSQPPTYPGLFGAPRPANTDTGASRPTPRLFSQDISR
ncbi:hypothetical protein HBI25_106540 [Parastagonospora nodorum]|nr:hypothetical protein HBH53_027840 [Parastagonospora nodorum]KAH4059310.1 hypothetical protein HBH49_016580 [Parastagonospora nodorum]KAH4074763.1 hypothetical protein HBH50_029580 [Parastagonospora nodorum]KAH4096823.1 hypothetical protein HBH48_038460 [Parastagonospora nodorum]KAH4113516.1 hypothetical protein HBH47_210800 [Parastagonospora nodorum]